MNGGHFIHSQRQSHEADYKIKPKVEPIFISNVQRKTAEERTYFSTFFPPWVPETTVQAAIKFT